jgi:hypothetical protein
MKIIGITLSLIFLLLSCWKSVDPISRNGAVIGQWKESFQSYYIKQIKIPEDTTNIVELERHTLLEFTETRFTVETLPHVPTVLGVYDSLYNGTYQIKMDTIVFNISEREIEKKLLFKFYGEELILRIPSYPLNDSLMTIESSSFLWGGSMGKQEGTFRRIK